MGNYKFSGHETFQCRHFWLKKGYDFISSNKDFKANDALVELGVGKNMVNSMSYWLKAFQIADAQNESTELGQRLFDPKGFDPFLEDIGTQFILHYKIELQTHDELQGRSRGLHLVQQDIIVYNC